MYEPIEFSSWVAGWTALAFVVAYGIYIVARSRRHRLALSQIPVRVLVTGSRGKSGTVRLLHAIARASGHSAYGKVTGTIAVELLPDGTELPTKRLGAASVSEMPGAVVRAHELGADFGVFECMAVTPDLIKLVHSMHIQSEIVLIPSIRLDHLEEEGLTEGEILESIVDSLPGCKHLVVGIDQPDLLEKLHTVCQDKDIALTVALPTADQPRVLGHHPTNVAVALAAAQLLGFDNDSARAGLESVSIEPRALSTYVVDVENGPKLGLIDVGGANDPQSSFEAIEGLGLNGSFVIPIMVHRWERPLRSLVFMSAVLGRFDTVGVTGTLGGFTRFFHRFFPQHAEQPHRASRVVVITRAMAKDPAVLAKRLLPPGAEPTEKRFTLLLVENTHEPVADLLRNTFATTGQEVALEKWTVMA